MIWKTVEVISRRDLFRVDGGRRGQGIPGDPWGRDGRYLGFQIFKSIFELNFLEKKWYWIIFWIEFHGEIKNIFCVRWKPANFSENNINFENSVQAGYRAVIVFFVTEIKKRLRRPQKTRSKMSHFRIIKKYFNLEVQCLCKDILLIELSKLLFLSVNCILFYISYIKYITLYPYCIMFFFRWRSRHPLLTT